MTQAIASCVGVNVSFGRLTSLLRLIALRILAGGLRRFVSDVSHTVRKKLDLQDC